MSLAVGFTLLSLLLSGVSDVFFKKYSVIFLFEFGMERPDGFLESCGG